MSDEKRMRHSSSSHYDHYERQMMEERTLTEGFLRFLSIVLRYRWFIGITTVLAAAGIVAFAIASIQLPPDLSPLPNVYTANARLLLHRGADQNVSQSIMASLGVDGGGGGFDYGQIAGEVMQSRSFLDSIVEKNGIVEKYGIVHNQRTAARSIIAGRSAFGFNPRTGIFNIEYTDVDPEFAAEMVQSMVDGLLRWFADRGGSDRLVAVQTMEEKLGEVEERIRGIEAQIETFQRRYGVLQVEEIAQTQSQLLTQFQGQLLDVDLLISNQQRVSRMQNDPELAALRARRQNLLDLIQRIEGGYTGGTERLPPRDQLPALSADYQRLATELQIQNRIYQALTERYEVAKLTADTDPAFTILEPVEIPEQKSGPSRAELAASVTAGAFFGSILISLALHWIRSIRTDARKRRIFEEQETA